LATKRLFQFCFKAISRHSDVKTTLQLYAHSVSEDRLAAQAQMREAMLQRGNESRTSGE
jgi:hypothetical protein